MKKRYTMGTFFGILYGKGMDSEAGCPDFGGVGGGCRRLRIVFSTKASEFRNPG